VWVWGVQVGSRLSNTIYFSYDPPYVSFISPNVIDADGEVVRVEGRNFGHTQELAGTASLKVVA
jgi:hypothetical protein